MDINDDTRLDYESKYAGIANYWKNRQGMIDALTKAKTAELKQKNEAKFNTWANKKENASKYGKAVETINTYYSKTNEKARHDNYLMQILRGSSFATIAPITVNENSPYALFTIQNANGRAVKLSLAATNYLASAANDNATIGTDIANSLQYWNGGVWVNYVNDSTITAPSMANLLVRVVLNEQDAYEGPETFTLRVTDSSNNVVGYGVATIMDNGTGSIFTGDATVTDASAAFAAATTDAERAAALEIWRQANEVNSHAIIAGNQGAFYKADDGNYYVTGANASPTGTNQTPPTLLTSANGYNYTGTIIDVAVAGRSADQYFLLTTTGLYAWGTEDTGLNTSLTTNTSFQRINTHSKKFKKDFESSDIHISPDGLYLYASNRGAENNIAIFAIQNDGKLKTVDYQSTLGKHPRIFAIDETGKFLIATNAISGNVFVFKRNIKTGLLKKVGTELKIKNVSCVQIRKY